AMRLDMIVSLEAQRRSERIVELEREARRLEALAIAQDQARAEIGLRVDPSTPAFMQAFLDRWGSKVVAAARVDGSPDGWAASLRCAEALVWSVTVSSPDEIPQLASLLPKLIAELNRGLPQSGIDDADRQ